MEEEEPQSVAALKKAYAEIILNTVKEAAGRIKESEKKAAVYHQDLCNTKDEALRLLLRLKQMIHAKAVESESVSSSQQNKIDVLEAQLQEAEGMIVDLRAELNWFRDKLKKVRKNKVHSQNGETVMECEASRPSAVPEPLIADSGLGFVIHGGEKIQLDEATSASQVWPQNGTIAVGNESSCPSETPALFVPSPDSASGLEAVTPCVKSMLLAQTMIDKSHCNATEQGEQLAVSCCGNHSSRTVGLAASTVMGKTEDNLYSNKCMQRIRALEESMLARVLPSSREATDQQSLVRRELIFNMSCDVQGNSAEPSSVTKNMETVKRFTGEEVRKCVKVHTPRRRNARFGKLKSKSWCSPNKRMKSYQLPSILLRCRKQSANGNVKLHGHSETVPYVKSDNAKNNRGASEEKAGHQYNHNMDEKMIVHGGKTQIKMQSRDENSISLTSCADHFKFCRPSSVLNHGKTLAFSLYSNVKVGGYRSKVTENGLKLRPLTRLDPGKTLIRGDVDPVSGFANVTVSVKTLNRPVSVQTAANKDMELEDELVKQRDVTTANSVIPCIDLDTANKDVGLEGELVKKKAVVNVDNSVVTCHESDAANKDMGLAGELEKGIVAIISEFPCDESACANKDIGLEGEAEKEINVDAANSLLPCDDTNASNKDLESEGELVKEKDIAVNNSMVPCDGSDAANKEAALEGELVKEKDIAVANFIVSCDGLDAANKDVALEVESVKEKDVAMDDSIVPCDESDAANKDIGFEGELVKEEDVAAANSIVPCDESDASNKNVGLEGELVKEKDVSANLAAPYDYDESHVANKDVGLEGESIKQKEVHAANPVFSCYESDPSEEDMGFVVEKVKQDDVAASSEDPCSESDSELVDIPVLFSDGKNVEASKEVACNIPVTCFSDVEDATGMDEPIWFPTQTRTLQYTFQRKRKKEASSSHDQNTYLEKSSAKRRTPEKQSDLQEPQKSSSVNELFRRSRRLAQLISSSGERWCK